jgi:hypothetical protein
MGGAWLFLWRTEGYRRRIMIQEYDNPLSDLMDGGLIYIIESDSCYIKIRLHFHGLTKEEVSFRIRLP